MGDTSLVGTTVGNYEVKSLLGEGAMGQVFLGEHPQIGRKVAIKVLVAQLSASEEMANRFLAEAKAVNRISHPNIIQIFDFGRLPDGRLYYTMEFLEGQELTKVIAERAPLSVSETMAVVSQIAGALQAAHDAGIVHRDLKPDNIFVAQTAAGPTVKVLDFGIAKLLEPDLGSSQKTSTGMIMGTPLYMSPEQAAGMVADISPRSDIYALGIIVYQMLSGQVPFNAPTAAQLLAAHITEPPRPLSEVTEGLPESLEAVIEAALAKKPEDRPESAMQFLEALVAACADLPGELTATLAAGAAVGGGGVFVGSGAGSRPGAALASGLGSRPGAALGSGLGSQPGGGLAAVGQSQPGDFPSGAAATGPTTLGQSVGEQWPEQRSGKGRGALLLVGLVVLLAVGGLGAYFALRGGGEEAGEPRSQSRAAAAPAPDAAPRPTPRVRRRPEPPPRRRVAVHKIRIRSRTRFVRVEVRVDGRLVASRIAPFTVEAKTGERVVVRGRRRGYQEQVASLVADRDREVVLSLERIRRHGRVRRRPVRVASRPPMRPPVRERGVVAPRPPERRPPPRRVGPTMAGEGTLKPF